MSAFRCGLVVNPVAGLGGEAGLKGSDGVEIQQAALASGVLPRSNDRAVRALASVASLVGAGVQIVTGAGLLGEEAALAAGFSPRVVYTAAPGQTTADDSRALVRMLCAEEVGLIVFVGGDGTAKDVCAVTDPAQLVLGVPAGVKMHSGVFAVTPEAVGAVVRAVVAGEAQVELAEVVDIDEAARRVGLLRAQLYGTMRVPRTGRSVQSGKKSSESRGVQALSGIAAEIADRIRPDAVCLFGPGTTVQRIGAALGFEFSLLGVDAVCNGRLIGVDLNADQLNELTVGRELQVVVSPIGGQGVVLGRGNQQIDARLLGRLAPEDLIIACTSEKLGPLAGAPLLIDAPTVELNQKFGGVNRVVTGYRQEAVVRLG